MNPTPAAERPQWLEGLLFAWPVRLAMIAIGVGLWLWATAWSVRHRLRTLRWRRAFQRGQP
jgi:hypothetical protein